jgi:hypothetical protein
MQHTTTAPDDSSRLVTLTFTIEELFLIAGGITKMRNEVRDQHTLLATKLLLDSPLHREVYATCQKLHQDMLKVMPATKYMKTFQEIIQYGA